MHLRQGSEEHGQHQGEGFGLGGKNGWTQIRTGICLWPDTREPLEYTNL